MDKAALERSDQAFYQYEARKVMDYLRQKGVNKIRPNTAVSEALNLHYADHESVEDPKVIFDLAEFMRSTKCEAKQMIEYIEEYQTNKDVYTGPRGDEPEEEST